MAHATQCAASIMAQVEPLPIGSRHVYDAEFVLRTSQRFEHGGDPLQTQLGGLDFVAERVQELN